MGWQSHALFPHLLPCVSHACLLAGQSVAVTRYTSQQHSCKLNLCEGTHDKPSGSLAESGGIELMFSFWLGSGLLCVH